MIINTNERKWTLIYPYNRAVNMLISVKQSTYSRFFGCTRQRASTDQSTLQVQRLHRDVHPTIGKIAAIVIKNDV